MSRHAWDQYWQTGNRTTFGDKLSYKDELRDYWLTFFQNVGEGKVLVDLGAGNGALEEIAQECCNRDNRCMIIHAVDSATVHPRITSIIEDRLQIIWHPRTQNEATTLPAASVDAVTGNFAFEYGDHVRTIDEINRVMGPLGKCRFVMHHPDSIVIRHSRIDLDVLEMTLARGGVFDVAGSFLRDFGSVRKISQLTKVMKSENAKHYLEKMRVLQNQIIALACTPSAKNLADYILRGISALITPPWIFETRRSLLGRLAAAKSEYVAYRSRLQDMQMAQVDKARMKLITKHFFMYDMIVEARPFYVAEIEEPIGWAVDVSRKPSQVP